mgnify:CR=1 FL=1
MNDPRTIWTVGHSTHPLEQFIALLQHYRIEAVADVRRFPGSRRLPHFGEDALRASLTESGIDYRFIPQLGGRRRATRDTPNTGWRNASFRGYADHVASEEFAEGLEILLGLARQRRTAMMCAEVLWWRCHRSLVSARPPRSRSRRRSGRCRSLAASAGDWPGRAGSAGPARSPRSGRAFRGSCQSPAGAPK